MKNINFGSKVLQGEFFLLLLNSSISVKFFFFGVTVYYLSRTLILNLAHSM